MVKYKLIVVIVNKGLAEDVIESSLKKDARGATIISGRGSGVHEKNMLFGVPIETEKEVVLILSEEYMVEDIINQVNTDLKLEEPGKGILFVLPVTDVGGLRFKE